jgi:hypothetical protein
MPNNLWKGSGVAATLTWLDHDTADRDRMNRILSLFRERDTRDELGVGVIRDLVADEFFPGTSTIQTRLKYMLFVPWIYKQLEQEEWSNDEFLAEARKREVALVKVLSESDDTDGVFGKRAGGNLKRLPSSVYWAGLGMWQIRRFQGSQEQYAAAIDDVYEVRRTRHQVNEMSRRRGEGVDMGNGMSGVTWHSKLPPCPPNFPHGAAVPLTQEEAHFIQDQIITSQPKSLMARIIMLPLPDVEYPWHHPAIARFADEHKTLLHHADMLSQSIYGAAILYNLMLAEARGDAFLVSTRQDDASRWFESVDWRSLGNWSLDWVWPLAFKHQQVISPNTFDFCKRWVDLLLECRDSIMEDKRARELIRAREMRLKGGRSRFSNQRALDQWSGNAGLFRMNYRWPTVTRFVRDLQEGLAGEANA